jgi:DNA-binding response OmpR family regulator
MSVKILYVEDEPFLGQIVSDGLTASGYDVIRAYTGSEGLDLYGTRNPDLCILDIMLPNKDGYSLAASIRAQSKTIPIIFLSAKVLSEDVVKGFRNGGNDFLKKPFSMDELLVRIESLLNRFGINSSNITDKSVYNFGRCSLDTLNQKLKTSDQEFNLSYKECCLMALLIEHKNMILKRNHALNTIWGDDSFYNTRSMDVFMAHLRKLLKEETDIQILSIRSIGYKLVCDLNDQ